MTYYCKLCVKSKMNKSEINHLKSTGHKILDDSIIRRYIFLNPIFHQIDEIMKR